eukprot:1269352-Amphidinium_carterae.1
MPTQSQHLFSLVPPARANCRAVQTTASNKPSSTSMAHTNSAHQNESRKPTAGDSEEESEHHRNTPRQERPASKQTLPTSVPQPPTQNPWNPSARIRITKHLVDPKAVPTRAAQLQAYIYF